MSARISEQNVGRMREMFDAFQRRAFGEAELGVELSYRVVVTFRKGRIVLDEWCADRAEALEAVGLAR